MHFGPLYCETGHAIGFLQEPVNAATSLIPLIAAAAILFFMYRRGIQVWYLHLLAMLLAITGVGSFFWHGLRTAWALPLDYIPGVAVLLLFAYLWGMLLRGRTFGAAVVAGLILLEVLLTALFPLLLSVTFFFWVFVSVAFVAAVLIMLTFKRRASLGFWGVAVFGSAIIAAFFRTLDLYVCSYIPVGTHFLWHIFLSLAVYLGARFLFALDQSRTQ